MEKTSSNERKIDRKIDTLNQIFEEVITDAQDLIQDLSSGIIMYFLMGLMCILAGILNIWSNRQDITNGDSLTLILSVVLIISGPIIINRGLFLRKKYARLFKAGRRLNTI